jgi:hypothetical protein
LELRYCHPGRQANNGACISDPSQSGSSVAGESAATSNTPGSAMATATGAAPHSRQQVCNTFSCGYLSLRRARWESDFAFSPQVQKSIPTLLNASCDLLVIQTAGVVIAFHIHAYVSPTGERLGSGHCRCSCPDGLLGALTTRSAWPRRSVFLSCLRRNCARELNHYG